MKPLPRLRLAALIAACLTAESTMPVVVAHEVSDEIARTASALLASLSGDEKNTATFGFASGERTDWHFVPRSRNGIPLKAMAPEQRKLAEKLLQTSLSTSGCAKANGVMTLESVLREIEGRPDYRDPDRYFVSIFGEPGHGPWGWRFEGHHISLNFTFAADGSPAMTPSFFGANPAEVPSGVHKGMRLLAAEEDLARRLVTSLDAGQRAKAVIMDAAPDEIFNVPGRNSTHAEGISWSDLGKPQRENLMQLIQEYVGRARPEFAALDLERLKKAGLDSLHFAWAGAMERGQPHYYRVQSGSFVLEYDNFQNNGNHVHSLWRDFDRDFGADLLGEHHQQSHGGK